MALGLKYKDHSRRQQHHVTVRVADRTGSKVPPGKLKAKRRAGRVARKLTRRAQRG